MSLDASQRGALLRHPFGWIACGFGSGLSPVAPGTAGSLVALLPWLALRELPWPWYLAALALALGLADVVESASGKVRLDTIFIDEGFGSLDTENGAGTLDQVLQVLNSIVRQNRAVGLISHVPLVQEAIPNGFYVRKGISGSSVEERGLV